MVTCRIKVEIDYSQARDIYIRDFLSSLFAVGVMAPGASTSWVKVPTWVTWGRPGDGRDLGHDRHSCSSAAGSMDRSVAMAVRDPTAKPLRDEQRRRPGLSTHRLRIARSSDGARFSRRQEIPDVGPQE